MGRSGSAKLVGKLQCRSAQQMWIILGQGPIALAVGAGGGCLDIFSRLSFFNSPGRSPGRGIVLRPALASALAKC